MLNKKDLVRKIIKIGKENLVRRVMRKLAKLNIPEVNLFLKELTEVTARPEAIKKLLKKFDTEWDLNQIERQQLLFEIKKKDLVKEKLPGVDEAWRDILKDWHLEHYRLWSL